MTDLTQNSPTPSATADPNALPDRNGGGTGNAGGTEIHAMAMVLAAVNMMRGRKIGWLDGVAGDVPVAITAETGGRGDDIGLDLINGEKVEVQSKKKLQRGKDLWDALDALALGIEKGVIQYGVLVVTSGSSGSIRNKLAADIVKIGQGTHDSLDDIGEELLPAAERGLALEARRARPLKRSMRRRRLSDTTPARPSRACPGMGGLADARYASRKHYVTGRLGPPTRRREERPELRA